MTLHLAVAQRLQSTRGCKMLTQFCHLELEAGQGGNV